MKKLFLIPIAIVLLASLLFGSCAAPAAKPAPAPAPAIAPAPTPTTPAEPIKLRFSFAPPLRTAFHTLVFEPWAEKIKERTTAIGKPVEVVFYGGGALGSVGQQYELTKTGMADISAIWSPMQLPGIFVFHDIYLCPFVLTTSTITCQVEWEIYDTVPEMRKEFNDAGLKVLWFQSTRDANIFCGHRPVKTIEDLKGMKVACSGLRRAQTAEVCGAVPVMMSPPDVYLSLERKLLDGDYENAEAIFSTFKWHEITKYRTVMPKGMWAASLVVVMNPDSYNLLPPEVQKIFNELGGAYMSKLTGETMDPEYEESYRGLVEYDKKAGNPDHYFMPDEDFKKFEAAGNTVTQLIINELEAKGYPAKKTYEKILSLVQKYSK